jgi:hypothetical protein
MASLATSAVSKYIDIKLSASTHPVADRPAEQGGLVFSAEGRNHGC